MKIRKPFQTVFALFLAAVVVLSMMPATADAASSAQIQEELQNLRYPVA